MQDERIVVLGGGSVFGHILLKPQKFHTNVKHSGRSVNQQQKLIKIKTKRPEEREKWMKNNHRLPLIFTTLAFFFCV